LAPGRLRDEAEVSDGDPVPSVVEIAPVGVGDVVEVGVLLAVQTCVVVHRGRVVNLLGKPSERTTIKKCYPRL
jgi:hypothetical protein